MEAQNKARDIFAQISDVPSVEMLDAIVMACQRQKDRIVSDAIAATAKSHIGSAFADGGRSFLSIRTPTSFAEVAATAAELPTLPDPPAPAKKPDGLYIPCGLKRCDCMGYRRHIEQECATCAFYSVGELPMKKCPNAAPLDTTHVMQLLRGDPRGWGDVDWTGLFLRGLPIDVKIKPRKSDGLHGRLRRVALAALGNDPDGLRVHVIADRENPEYPYGTAIIRLDSHHKAAAVAKALRAHFKAAGDDTGFFCNYRQRNSKQNGSDDE